MQAYAKAQNGSGMTSLRTRQRLIDELRRLGVRNDVVLDHLMEMPRHLFVEEALASRAYENKALPIGYGQTISQPHTVARMTELLLEGGLFKQQLTSGIQTDSVLEIGTGCGYQTLLLSRLFNKVTSVERITQLHRKARNRLYDLGVRNVTYKLDDGFVGQFIGAPFDGIVAAAVSKDVPIELIDQLKVGGRLVMPLLVDKGGNQQHLIVVDKLKSGVKKEILDPVSFVSRQSGIS